jgi:hypothetical protein
MVRRAGKVETDIANIKDCLSLLHRLLLNEWPKVNGMLATITLTHQCVLFACGMATRSDQCHERPVVCLLLFALEVFAVVHRWGLSGARGATL